jgi:hypothetical protein
LNKLLPSLDNITILEGATDSPTTKLSRSFFTIGQINVTVYGPDIMDPVMGSEFVREYIKI